MQIIHYPIKGRTIDDVINQQTFDRLMTRFTHWQQGPGVVGRLNLHACWGKTSVLDRRYQGETVFVQTEHLAVVRRLYDVTKNPKWRVLANSMAAHLLYLQDESGGFIHATCEFEPTFDTRGCPIHMFNPVIALCEYAQWEYADADIKALIPAALDRHWEWSLAHVWKVGNGRLHPLDFAGWCGVTNQDLVAIAALALTGKVFGNWERYEQYGKPSLEVYLSPRYYHKDIGLFERGDGVNYAERTTYHMFILNMFRIIYECTGDERVFAAYENVIAHLFDAVFVGKDGLTYLARGAKTDAVDKSRVYEWEYGAIPFDSYPRLYQHMRDYVKRHPDAKRARMVEELGRTIAGYVFVDGSVPMGIFNPNPMFSIVSTPDYHGFLAFVAEELGDELKDPQPTASPVIHRTLRNMTWKQKGPLWAIEKDGVRQYGGYSRYAGGVTIGPEETPVCGDFAALEECEYWEIVDA